MDLLGILGDAHSPHQSGQFHMGWEACIQPPHPLLAGLDDVSHVYFVHSYYVPVEVSPPRPAIMVTISPRSPREIIFWGVTAPERSGHVGARIL